MVPDAFLYLLLRFPQSVAPAWDTSLRGTPLFVSGGRVFGSASKKYNYIFACGIRVHEVLLSPYPRCILESSKRLCVSCKKASFGPPSAGSSDCIVASLPAVRFGRFSLVVWGTSGGVQTKFDGLWSLAQRLSTRVSNRWKNTLLFFSFVLRY